MNRLIDLAGKRFGNLLVISKAERPKNKKAHCAYWLCRCDCGKEKVIISRSLRIGNTITCGCKNFSYGEHSSNQLLNAYKIGAKKRGISFALTKEEFLKITKQDCFYCGKSPESKITGKRANGSYVYNGIDRLDNSVGYIVENCVPCCGVCNYMKRKMTKDEFLNHIKSIYNNIKF